ncbi:DNA polymerase II [Salmonella enterica subsp. enterica]|uniref:DNA polymerase II n=1 Tax=Salmonella enterica I TaxID=59201 RepID=A0A3S4LQ93_SALET|nr:DNA polymerase II [Salmonella enterica subsp. enterica]
MAQAGFILTRHWRDTPQGTEVSFWLATDNGPVQATLAPQESVAFIPTSQTSRAASLLQAEKRLSPDAAPAARLSSSAGIRSVLPHSPPAYADGETAARKTASPFMKRMYARRNVT